MEKLIFLLVAFTAAVHSTPLEQRETIGNTIARYCEVAKCAQHRFAYGGIFTEKYDFEDMFTKVESMDYIARLTLFAKASGTVSIRLGVYSSQDEEYGEYYDIVFGAENNTQSWLGVGNQKEPLQKLLTPNIVTDTMPHKIRIEIPEGGLIKVFLEHYHSPIFEVPHINPFHVNYIAFAAGYDENAEFFFDCDDADRAKRDSSSSPLLAERAIKDSASTWEAPGLMSLVLILSLVMSLSS